MKPNPCPFCAPEISKPEVRAGLLRVDREGTAILAGKQVVCATCGTSGPRCGTDKIAVELWNSSVSRPAKDNLHVPLECNVTDCATPPALGAETSIVGPDGNRRAYIVTGLEPMDGGGWHIKIDPKPAVSGSVGHDGTEKQPEPSNSQQ